ncbi:MAG: GNAT family N-acetyltransferase [Deltaproteobacteria bacterium]|nr:GNAT family N-acetyltransferase [Deltaproteobacteria bacterium]
MARTPRYWPDEYLQKRRTPAEAIKLIQPGQRVFITSGTGEPQGLVQALADAAVSLPDLEIVRLLSLEAVPLTMAGGGFSSQSFNVRSFYLGSAKPRELARNKRFLTPINLSAVPRLFKSRQLPVHVALIQVSPPDDFGWMSLGVAVDVTMAAATSADLVIAQVNPNMPRVMGRSFIHVNQVHVVVELEEDLLTVGPPPDFESAHMIGRHVAKLIEDGATLQLSLGSSYQATLEALGDKGDLGIHTQFLTDGILHMVSAGVITNRKKGFNEGKLIASGAIGSRNLYEYIHDNPGIEFHPSDYVNDSTIIASNNKMTSIQVAMAMDLTGQVAADALPYNNFTGVSGMMDFVRGSQRAPEGKSILLLPSTTMDGKSSRIVPQMENLAVVVPRGDVQYVVTEYGVANLFGKNLQERAIALISIAHPDFRDELFYNAKEIGLLGPERTLADTIRSVYPLKVEETRQFAEQSVLFRPARPTDERLIQEHFYALEREDVINRFMHEKRTFLRSEVADQFQVDYVHDMTIVAVIGETGFERIIGLGNYFFNPADKLAEVAFSVSRDWQGHGIAGIILKKLAAAARENHIAGFMAMTNASNQSMIRLFHKLPYKVRTSLEEDTLILKARFDEPKEG